MPVFVVVNIYKSCVLTRSIAKKFLQRFIDKYRLCVTIICEGIYICMVGIYAV